MAIVDTVYSPDGIDYVIPVNDDAIRSIELYLNAIVEGVLEKRAETSYLDEEKKEEKKESVKIKKTSKKEIAAIEEIEQEAPLDQNETTEE